MNVLLATLLLKVKLSELTFILKAHVTNYLQVWCVWYLCKILCFVLQVLKKKLLSIGNDSYSFSLSNIFITKFVHIDIIN